MYQLDKVAYEAHDSESNSDCPADLKEFLLGWLCASSDELVTVFYELLRNFSKLFQFLGHVGSRCRRVTGYFVKLIHIPINNILVGGA